jgi:Rrf2 family transcriptional regulator, nitric oxide-sensitive transcriptional repressor
MRLSLHADYALRTLIYLGAHPGESASTEQISRAYGISKNHLVRVIQTLGQRGYLHVTPGRTGGISLARDPMKIRLGQVVRDAEPNLNLVECFDKEANTCPITSICGLKRHLHDALNAFLTELDRHTLAHLLTDDRRKHLVQILQSVPSTAQPAVKRQPGKASTSRR